MMPNFLQFGCCLLDSFRNLNDTENSVQEPKR